MLRNLTIKTLGLALLAAVVANTSAQAQTPPVDQPTDSSIYSPDPSVDFGELLQGEKRKHTFVVGNRGAEDLQIRRVNPTCGCTVAQVKTPAGDVLDPKKQTPGTDLLTLKPEEICEIMIEFNSAGQPAQKLKKTIVVISSDNKQPALRLTLNVNVTKGIQVEPNPLQFGDVIRGNERSARTFAKLIKVDDITITGWQKKPEYVDVKWEETKAPDGTRALAFDVTILPTAPIGYLSTELVASTDHPKMKALSIHLYANVKSEVVFETGNKMNQERIDFEVITAGESAARTIEIKNGNPTIPYQIEGIEVDSKYKDQITVNLVTVEEGSHYKIELTTSPELSARFFRGILKIRSTHTELPEKQIHFHGWVKKT